MRRKGPQLLVRVCADLWWAFQASRHVNNVRQHEVGGVHFHFFFSFSKWDLLEKRHELMPPRRVKLFLESSCVQWRAIYVQFGSLIRFIDQSRT